MTAHAGTRLKQSAAPGIVALARAGFVARGVISAVIGVLAAMEAFGHTGNGRTTDSKGALRELHDHPLFQPFGRILLGIVAVGLVGYAVWLFVQGILDPEHSLQKNAKKRVFQRIGRIGGGLLHTGLAVFAIGLITGIALGNEEDGTKSWAARILGLGPIGVALVVAVGIGVLALAGWEIWKAWKSDLDDRLDLSRLSKGTQKLIVQLSRFGMVARAVAMVVIGVFLIIAAVRAKPDEARGLGSALSALQESPLGWPLLGVVAIGFIAYGVFQVIEARYRRICAT